jgi:hypothetical protein
MFFGYKQDDVGWSFKFGDLFTEDAHLEHTGILVRVIPDYLHWGIGGAMCFRP